MIDLLSEATWPRLEKAFFGRIETAYRNLADFQNHYRDTLRVLHVDGINARGGMDDLLDDGDDRTVARSSEDSRVCESNLYLGLARIRCKLVICIRCYLLALY